MSFVITIAQRKGGVGKTTLACQLAVSFAQSGYRVAGIDCDFQGSFAQWAARRAAKQRDIRVVNPEKLTRFSISENLWGLKQIADIVIIDTAPNVDGLVQDAINAANIVLTPLQLSRLDLDAILPTVSMIGEAGKDVLFVANRTPNRSRIADRIRNEAKRQSLPFMSTELGNRTAYIESTSMGMGVVETAPHSKASEEILSLTREIAARSGLSLPNNQMSA